MPNFIIVRLGRDSVADITAIDAMKNSPATPSVIVVNCKQVSSDVKFGDFAFVYLGSDNDNGSPTAWVKGIRALGQVTAINGGPKYSDSWAITISISVVMPESVTKRDLLAISPAAYFWCCEIPVVGLVTYSNQTIQLIKSSEANQNVSALLHCLMKVHASFETDVLKSYPALHLMLGYIPPSPATATAPTLLTSGVVAVSPLPIDDIVAAFVSDANASNLRVDKPSAHRFFASLMSKRFLIATGLAGSGKTKLSQAVAHWLTPPFVPNDPFTPKTKIESERINYFVESSDTLAVEFWNSDEEKDAIKVVLPRALIQEWADHIAANNLKRDTTARDIREKVKTKSKFSDQLNSFETHLKAAAFAMLAHPDSQKKSNCYEVVPVGADWTGNENILGYPNGLDETSYVAKPALHLILKAIQNPQQPYFLILDEMNLSHVERYFSDVLSAIESDEKIHLHGEKMRSSNSQVVPQIVALPKNLFVIGTVNVDETTYMFSPKVLDRANVIEFRVDASELSVFMSAPSKPDLNKLAGKGIAYAQSFVQAARAPLPTMDVAIKAAYETEMLCFFKVLSTSGAEYGYRVAHEAARFINYFQVLGKFPAGDVSWLAPAMDRLVLQKFLPKLHGSRAKLGPLLKKLWFLCVADAALRGTDPVAKAEESARSNDKGGEPSLPIPMAAPYPLSAEKILRMWKLLNENGFASFAEA